MAAEVATAEVERVIIVVVVTGVVDLAVVVVVLVVGRQALMEPRL